MIITTTGRTSGLPRRTAIEFHTYHGRKYVMNGYGMRSDWYRNILADARVTIQTADGVARCRARRVTGDAELAEAYGFVEADLTFRRFVQMLGVELSRKQFIAHKERWYLMTFAPTTEPTPPPLAADLWWGLPLVASSIVVFALVLRRRDR